MCQFVRLVKGINYIQEVQELTRSTQPTNAPTVSHMNIDEAMATAPVRLALEMGVDAGSIKNKTQQQLLLTGNPYSTVEDLLKAVFDEQESEELNPQAGHIRISHRGDCTETSESTLGEHVANSNVIASNDIATNLSVNEINEHRDGSTGIANNGEISGSDAQYVNDNKASEKTSNKLELNETVVGSSCTKTNERMTSFSLEEENRKLKDARLCKVCLDEEVGVVYLPCGHLVTCVQCAPGVNQCPMCRTTIKGFVRTYLS